MCFHEYRFIRRDNELKLALIEWDPESPGIEIHYIPTYGALWDQEAIITDIAKAKSKPEIIWNDKNEEPLK